MPLLIGTGQMGMVVYDSIEVSNAALCGSAVRDAEHNVCIRHFKYHRSRTRQRHQTSGTFLVRDPDYLLCLRSRMGGTQYTGTNAQANATAACTGRYNRAVEFIQVNTSVAVTPMARCPGLPTSYTLTGTSAMEVEP